MADKRVEYYEVSPEIEEKYRRGLLAKNREILGMNKELQEDWVDKIYGVILTDTEKKSIGIIKDNLKRLYQITEADLEKMEKEGYIQFEGDTLIKKDKLMDEYYDRQVIRKNWLYLSHAIRKKLVEGERAQSYKAVLPSVASKLLSSECVNIECSPDVRNKIMSWNVEGGRVMEVLESEERGKFVRRGGEKVEITVFDMKIKRRDGYFYHWVYGLLCDFITVGGGDMDDISIRELKHRGLNISGYVEGCPLGISKDECKTYWRQYEGVDKYAYRDVEYNGVPFRIYLSRVYRGIYYEINTKHLWDFERGKEKSFLVDYGWMAQLLITDGVMDLIFKNRLQRRRLHLVEGFVPLVAHEGFIPIYKKWVANPSGVAPRRDGDKQ